MEKVNLGSNDTGRLEEPQNNPFYGSGWNIPSSEPDKSFFTLLNGQYVQYAPDGEYHQMVPPPSEPPNIKDMEGASYIGLHTCQHCKNIGHCWITHDQRLCNFCWISALRQDPYLRDLSDGITRCVHSDDAQGKFDWFNITVNHKMDMKSITQSLSGMFDALKSQGSEVARHVESFIGLCLALATAYVVTSPTEKVLVLTSWAVAAHIPTSCMNMIASFAEKVTEEKEESDDELEYEPLADAQGVFEGMKNAGNSILEKFFYPLLAWLSGVKESCINWPSIKDIKLFSAAWKGIKDCLEIFTYARKAINTIIEYITPSDDSIFRYNQNKIRAREWINEASDLLNLAIDDEGANPFERLWIDMEFRKQVKDIMDRGKQIEQALVWGAAVRDNVYIAVRNTNVSLEKSYGFVLTAIQRKSGSRDEPVVIYLYGLPGVGKSYAVKYLNAFILKHEGANENQDQSVFYCNPKENFETGYEGHEVVYVLDDWNGLDDKAKVGEIAADMLHKANSVPAKTHQADIEGKKGVYFKSPYIILTSNTSPKVAVDSCKANLTEPTAFLRRIDITLEVTRVKETRGTLGYKFRMRNAFDNDFLGIWKTLNFAELCVKIADIRAVKKQKALTEEKIREEMERIFREIDTELPVENDEPDTDKPDEATAQMDSKEEMEFCEPEDKPKKWKVLNEQAYDRDYPTMHHFDGAMMDFAPRKTGRDVRKDRHIHNIIDVTNIVRELEEENATLDHMINYDNQGNKKTWSQYFSDVVTWKKSHAIHRPQLMREVCIHSMIKWILQATKHRIIPDLANKWWFQVILCAHRKENCSRRHEQYVWFEKYYNHPIDAQYDLLMYLKNPKDYGHTIEEIMTSHGISDPEMFLFMPHYVRLFRKTTLFTEKCEETIKRKLTESFDKIGSVLGTTIDTIRIKFPLPSPESLKKRPEWKHTKHLIWIGAILGVVVGGYLLYQSMKPTPEQFVEEVKALPQSKYDSTNQPQKPAREIYSWRTGPTTRVNSYKPNNATAQGNDNNTKQFCTSSIRKNAYNVIYKRGTKSGAMHILFIKERMFICVKHLMDQLFHKEEPIEIQFYQYGIHRFSVDVPDPNHIIGIGRDVCLVQLPDKHVPMHRDISNKFYNERNFNFLLQNQYMQYVQGNVGEIRHVHGSIYHWPVVYSVEQNNYKYEHDTVISIDFTTNDGDCGAPLLCTGTQFTSSPIVGIHVGGSPNYHIGYTQIISQEDIDAALDLMKSNMETCSCIHCDIPEPQTVLSGIDLKGRAKYIETLPPKESVYLPSSTSIRPSRIVDGQGKGMFGGPHRQPARLRRYFNGTDWVDPIQNAVNKFDREEVEYTPDMISMLDECVRALSERLPKVDPKPFSHDEVANGRGALPGTHTNGSAGYKCKVKENSTKGWWYRCSQCNADKFCEHQNQPGFKRKATDELIRKADERIASFYTNKPMRNWQENYAKDELKAPEKVDKPRLFNNDEVDNYHDFKRYFGPFMEARRRNPFKAMTGCGLNVHSKDWGVLKHELSRFKKLLPGDFEKFDASCNRWLVRAAVKVINLVFLASANSAYPREMIEKDNFVREQLVEMSFIEGRQILGDIVYAVFGHVPSGSVITLDANDVIDILLHMVTWLWWARDNKIPSPNGGIMQAQDFFSFNGINATGDDHIHATNSEGFDMFEKQKYMKKMGYNYTNPDKSEIQKGQRDFTWENITYLKRSFTEVKGEIRAPLPMDVIEDITCWVKKGEDILSATWVNLNMALFEMWHHGDEKYERFREKVVSFAQLYDIQDRPMTLDTRYEMFENNAVLGVVEEDEQIIAAKNIFLEAFDNLDTNDLTMSFVEFAPNYYPWHLQLVMAMFTLLGVWGEEVCKRFSIYWCLGIVFTEFFMKLMRSYDAGFGLKHGLAFRLLCVVLQLCLAYLPFNLALFVHAMWNGVIFCAKFDYGEYMGVEVTMAADTATEEQKRAARGGKSFHEFVSEMTSEEFGDTFVPQGRIDDSSDEDEEDMICKLTDNFLQLPTTWSVPHVVYDKFKSQNTSVPPPSDGVDMSFNCAHNFEEMHDYIMYMRKRPVFGPVKMKDDKVEWTMSSVIYIPLCKGGLSYELYWGKLLKQPNTILPSLEHTYQIITILAPVMQFTSGIDVEWGEAQSGTFLYKGEKFPVKKNWPAQLLMLAAYIVKINWMLKNGMFQQKEREGRYECHYFFTPQGEETEVDTSNKEEFVEKSTTEISTIFEKEEIMPEREVPPTKEAKQRAYTFKPKRNPILERRMRVADGQITSSMGIYHRVFDIEFPGALLQKQYFAAVLSRFSMMTWDSITFEILVNGTEMHQGMAWVFNLRGTDFDSDLFNRYNTLNLLNQPYKHLANFAKRNTVKGSIPWFSPLNAYHFDTSPLEYPSMGGRLIMDIQFPLNNVNAASVVPINYTVFANFCNPQYFGERSATIEELKAEQTLVSKHVKRRTPHKIEPQGTEMEEVSKKDGVISTALSAISEITAGISSIPYVGKYAAATSAATGFAANVFKFFKYSAVTDVRGQRIMQPRAVTSTGNADHVFNAHKLALHPNCRLGIDKMYDDSEWIKLKRYVDCPTFIAVGAITASTPKDTPFYTLELHPSICYDVGGYYYPGYPQRVTDMTQFSRVNFKFGLICNGMRQTSCRIMVCYLPPDTTFTTVDELFQVNSLTFNLDGSTKVSWSVAYLSNRYTLANPGVGRLVTDNSRMGTLVFVLLNTPTTAGSTGVSRIDYQLFFSFDEDSQFFVPRAPELDLRLIEQIERKKDKVIDISKGTTKRYHAQGCTDEKKEKVKTCDTCDFQMWWDCVEFPPIGEAGKAALHGINMSEEVTSWIELAQRKMHLTTLDIPVNVINDPVNLDAIIYDFPVHQTKFYEWLLSLFYCWKGEMQVALLPVRTMSGQFNLDNCHTESTLYVQRNQNLISADLSPWGKNFDYMKLNSPVQLVVPYFNMHRVTGMFVNNLNMERGFYFNLFSREATETGTERFLLYFGFGEDFQMFVPAPPASMPVPVLKSNGK